MTHRLSLQSIAAVNHDTSHLILLRPEGCFAGGLNLNAYYPVFANNCAWDTILRDELLDVNGA